MAIKPRPGDSAGAAPLNRAALIAAVAEQAELTGGKATQVVNAVFGTIQGALCEDREVRLAGFGSFAVATRKPTTGRNPRTGAAIDIGPSASVKFRPGRGLKEAVGKAGGRLAQR